MANALYDAGRNGFAEGTIVWKASGGSTIKVALLSSAYTVNLSSHANLSDTTGVVATSGALTLIDPVAGVCDANDITFSAVSGSTVTQAIIYKDTGTSSTSTLIAHIDTATGLSVTPNGGDIQIQFDNGSNKIFKL